MKNFWRISLLLTFIFTLSGCKNFFTSDYNQPDTLPDQSNSSQLDNNSNTGDQQQTNNDDGAEADPFAAPAGSNTMLKGERHLINRIGPVQPAQIASAQLAQPLLISGPKTLAIFDDGTGLYSTYDDQEGLVGFLHKMRLQEEVDLSEECKGGSGHFRAYLGAMVHGDEEPAESIAIAEMDGQCSDVSEQPVACFALATYEQQEDVCTQEPDICVDQAPVCTSQPDICTEEVTDHNGRTISPAVCTPQPDVCTTPDPVCTPGAYICEPQQPLITDLFFFAKEENGCLGVERFLNGEIHDGLNAGDQIRPRPIMEYEVD